MHTTLAARLRQHPWLYAIVAFVANALYTAPVEAVANLGERLHKSALYVPIAGADDVEGARGTGNIGANILETDFADKVLELEPDATPLLVLTAKLDKGVAVNPKYTWFEDKLDARFDQIAGAQLIGDTTLEVDTVGIWHADDLGYNTRTGEIFRVVSVAADLTVVRGVGGGAAAMNDNDEIILINSAAEEGALDKPAHSYNPAEVFNYTQIFRKPVEITGTARSTKNRTTPHDWDRQLNKKGIEHAKDIEYGALFGKPSIDTTGTHPRRTTGGFNHYATQNITDVGGAMTEMEFFEALRSPFRYGSRTKLAMAAAKPVDIVTAFPRAKLQIAQSEETFGIKVMQIVSPHGRVNFVTHWLLEGNHADEIWLADTANIGYRYLHGDDGSRDTRIRHEIQTPGKDGRKDEYLTECGFVFAQPLTHGKIINITS